MDSPQLSLRAFPVELLCIITSNLSIESLIILILSGELLQVLTPCLQSLSISYYPKWILTASSPISDIFPLNPCILAETVSIRPHGRCHYIFKAKNMMPDSLTLLPASLTSLEFGTPITWSKQTIWQKKDMFNSLVNLKKLSISNQPPPLSFIPPWLTDLQLSYEALLASNFIKSSDWKSIPPGLTRFHLDNGHVDFTSEELAMSLPPSVTQLVLRLAHPLGEEHLRALLRSLKLLSMMSKSGVCQPMRGQAEDLPQSIETLQISGSKLPPIGTLPPKLKHLMLSNSKCTHYPHSLTILEKVKISYSDFCSLPRTLTRLTMALIIPLGYDTSTEVTNAVDATAQPGLPDGIMELEIEASVPLRWQAWLPKKLQYLRFNELDPVHWPDGPATDWLAKLPERLQVLKIRLSHHSRLNTHIEALLPHPSWQHMSIKSTKNALDIECFCNLPRKLESLDMTVMTTMSSAAPFSFLPPRIRSLKLRTLLGALFYLPTEVLNVLPPKLRHFNVPTGITSQSSWKTLAKQLHILYDINTDVDAATNSIAGTLLSAHFKFEC